MGDENSLRGMVGEIMGSLHGIEPIDVVGLDFEEENEATFDEAVDKAWMLLGKLDAFVNCYSYEGNFFFLKKKGKKKPFILFF